MKIFVYKTLFVFVCIFILFQLTVGMTIKQLNHKLEKFQSKENYLTPDDAKLINEFINKLKKELSN